VPVELWVPLDLEDVPQYLRSYASGVQVSRAYSLKVQKLGGLEVVECEQLCILSDGKDQVGKEGLIIRYEQELCGTEGEALRSRATAHKNPSARRDQALAVS
jgi:hypothetical protein